MSSCLRAIPLPQCLNTAVFTKNINQDILVGKAACLLYKIYQNIFLYSLLTPYLNDVSSFTIRFLYILRVLTIKKQTTYCLVYWEEGLGCALIKSTLGPGNPGGVGS
jgi:hypothetical protein